MQPNNHRGDGLAMPQGLPNQGLIHSVLKGFGPRRVGGFIRLLIVDFIHNGGLQNAASLTYTTLLSLVPLMTVTLAVLSAFPIAGTVGDMLQDFVFKNFVPTSGEVLQDYMQEFSAKASRLSGAGFVFLIIVALMMMATIEQAFNGIWHVHRKRRFLVVFLIYWAVLTLGPMLIGISVALTSYLVSLPLISDATSGFEPVRKQLGLMPLLASAVAFILLYALVPNRRVRFRHALAGGLFAALLFEATKRAFALYVAYFPTYQAIYGALAIIPIFLIWIYLSWLVTLLGAQFTYCLGACKGAVDMQQNMAGTRLLLAFRLLEQLWRAQQRGNAVKMERLADSNPEVVETDIEAMLKTLQGARLVVRTDTDDWVLVRDLGSVSLAELYRSGPFILPTGKLWDQVDRDSEQALATVVGKAEQELAQTLEIPLAELFATDQGAVRRNKGV